MIPLLAAMLSAAPATADPLPATSQWTVDYADAQCSLSRDFGVGERRVTLGIVSIPDAEMVDLVVIEPNGPGGAPKPAKLSLLPEGLSGFAGRGAVAVAAKSGGRITRAAISRNELDTLRAATRVTVTVDGRAADLHLSQMAAAIRALAACEADLLRQWGVDPASLARIKTNAVPAGMPGTWLTDDDYPTGALRRRESGATAFRLILDADGRVRNCGVLKSSGSPELDAAVCAIIPRRARFNPARDANGVAVPAMFVSRFIWALPH